MAQQVDEILVKIKGDIKDLKSSLTKMKSEIDSSSSKGAQSLEQINNKLSNIGGAAKAAGAAIATAFAANTFRGMVKLGADAETTKRRLSALFGSAEDAEKAFKIMEKAASSTGFALTDMQQVSSSLAVAVGGDVNKLEEALKVVMNISEASGMSLDEATSNFVRASTAGIASAELFKERGVAAMAGFEVGVSYSAAETVKKLQGHFGSGGDMGTVADDMGGTLSNLLSNIGDEFDKFQRAIMDSGVSDALKRFSDAMIEAFETNEDLAGDIADVLVPAIDAAATAVTLIADNIDLLIIAAKAFIAVKLAGVVLGIGRALIAARAAMAAYIITTKAAAAANLSLAATAGTAAKALKVVQFVLTLLGPGKFIKIAMGIATAGAALLGLRKKSTEAKEETDGLSAEIEALQEELNQTETATVSLAKETNELSDAEKKLAKTFKDVLGDIHSVSATLDQGSLSTIGLNEELNRLLESAGLSPFSAYVKSTGDLSDASVIATGASQDLADAFLDLARQEEKLKLRETAADIQKFSQETGDAKYEVDEYDDHLKDLKLALDKGAISQNEFNDIVKGLDAKRAASDIKELTDELEKVTRKTDLAEAAQNGYNKEFANLVSSLGKDPLDIYIDSTGELINVTGESEEQFAALADEVKRGQGIISDTTSQEDAKSAFQALDEEIYKVNQQLVGIKDPLTKAEAETNGYSDAVDVLTKKQNALKAVEMAGSIIEQYDASNNATQAMNELEAAVALATGNYNLFKEAVAASGINASITEEQFKALSGQYGLNTDDIKAMQDQLDILKIKQESPFVGGVLQGMKDFYSENSDLAANMASVTKNVFGELEGALSDFFVTGKVDFKSFTNAIKRGLADVAAKAIVTTGLNFLDKAFDFDIKKDGGAVGKFANGGFVGRFDSGGFLGSNVGAVGGPRDDANLALLSRGEYVINARSVGLFGKTFFDRLNAGIDPSTMDTLKSLPTSEVQEALGTLPKKSQDLLGSMGFTTNGFDQALAQHDGNQHLPQELVEEDIAEFGVGGWWKVVKKGFKKLTDGIGNTIRGVFDAIKDLFDGVADAIRRAIGWISDSVKKIINGILNGDLGLILTLLSTFVLPGVGGGIMGAFGQAFTAGGGGLGALIPNVTQAITASFGKGLFGVGAARDLLISAGTKLMKDVVKDTLISKLSDFIQRHVFGMRNASGDFRGDMSSNFKSMVASAAPHTSSTEAYASGGHVSGRGTSRSDSIPALLSNGEYVINASAVRKYGVGNLNLLNSGSMPRFASGGSVGAVLQRMKDFMENSKLNAFIQKTSSKLFGSNPQTVSTFYVASVNKNLIEIGNLTGNLIASVDDLTASQEKRGVEALERGNTITRAYAEIQDKLNAVKAAIAELKASMDSVDSNVEIVAERASQSATSMVTPEGGSGFNVSGSLDLGNNSVIVNQSVHLTAGVAGMVRAEVENLMPQFKTQVLAAIVQAKRNGYAF